MIDQARLDFDGPSLEASASSDPLRSAVINNASPGLVTEREKRVAAKLMAGTSLDKLGYSWDQDENEVRVYLSLAGASSEELRCDFSSRSCGLTATVDSQRYFFDIKRTFAPINPSLSRTKVPRSKRHVELRLRKHEPGVEWLSLRCVEADMLHNL